LERSRITWNRESDSKHTTAELNLGVPAKTLSDKKLS
jgi:hypothetical protein